MHGVVGVVPLLCGRGFVVLRKPSWTWHTRMGVPRQLLGGGRRCRPSSFPGSWAFVVESVVVDVAHPDGRATSAVWWWVGVVVGVCIVDVVDDVDDVGVGLTWRCGGHDGGVGWWRLTTSGGRRGMVVVEKEETCGTVFANVSRFGRYRKGNK